MAIGTARLDFDEQIEKIADDLGRGDLTLPTFSPTWGQSEAGTYLIAGQNNADMRDQGDVVSLALMHIVAGGAEPTTYDHSHTFTEKSSPRRPILSLCIRGPSRPSGSLWKWVSLSFDNANQLLVI